ncbi:MobF family relaxase [Streptomyces sp. NPDC052292]|uniref:MobF family relaxase n=1 Tax=Streptomyces sp. NPDC052292 TaxID=3155053 RepID=UPI00343C96CB
MRWARKSPATTQVTVTGVDFVFRPQPTIYLLWALGDEETRQVIEAAHERAIERVLEWIEDEVEVLRYGKDGIYRVRPPGGLVAVRFRHYEARSGRPLLHDHLLLSVKGQRLDGKWGSIHTTALHENTVAASALYNELVAAELCETLGLATEPRTVTPGRRPVMESDRPAHPARYVLVTGQERCPFRAERRRGRRRHHRQCAGRGQRTVKLFPWPRRRKGRTPRTLRRICGDFDSSVQWLTGILAGHARLSPDHLADTLLSRLGVTSGEDDIALIVARL